MNRKEPLKGYPLGHPSLRTFAEFLFSLFILASVLSPVYECGGGADDADDDASSTPIERCRDACDVLYGCGIAIPDDETGAPLSVVECRAGCEKEPGNIECVDSCIDQYQINGDCDDLQGCVSDMCAIPVGK